MRSAHDDKQPLTMHSKMKLLSILQCLTVFWMLDQSAAYDVQEPFDLNLLLALRPGPSGYEYPGILMGEARGEPRELPARLDVGYDGQAYWYGKYVSPCCRRWEADGWVQLDDEQATSTRPLLDNNYKNGGKPLAGVYALQQEEGTIISPPLPAQFSFHVTELVCMKVLAKVPEGSRISVIAENTDGSGAMEIGEIIGTSDYEWTLTKLEKAKDQILHGREVIIKILGRQQKNTINKALIQWTTFCADETELHDYYNAPFLRKNSTQVRYSLLVPPGKFGTVQSPVCLNGGRLDLDLGLCQCAPGFSGPVCETSCGPNKYGVHCTGSCSPLEIDRQCHGILSCSDLGCKCFSGLHGDTCDEPCPPGFYGSDCQLTCGACGENDQCDRFSGQCPRGCRGGKRVPFCQEDCGRSYGKYNPTEVNYFWNVGIYEKKNKTYTRVCSASLVRTEYLLTAAWCFYSEENLALKPASQFVALFESDRQHCFDDDAFPTDVEARHILSIKVPQNYQGSKRAHADDIALVQLERPVVPAPKIAPLCYEPPHPGSTELPDGTTGVITTWYPLGKDCNSTSTLRGYQAHYSKHTTCLRWYPNTAQSITDTKKFCVVVPDGERENRLNAAGRRDIGSGFVKDWGDVWYIYGVKSGATASDSNFAVYTKVSDYLDWIVSTWKRLDVKLAVKENLDK